VSTKLIEVPCECKRGNCRRPGQSTGAHLLAEVEGKRIPVRACEACGDLTELIAAAREIGLSENSIRQLINGR
jgi:hypothetical protein